MARTANTAKTIERTERFNGIDVAALRGVIRAVGEDPRQGMVEFRVRSRWRGQTRSESEVESYSIGGRCVARSFKIRADEPIELLGENTAPNPQELLMTALNACMMVGYVAGAAARGITLERLEIETRGELDLRGFLGIDPGVPAGYESLRSTVRIRGDGSPEQLREIHATVLATSPNFFNLSRPVRIESELVVEG